MAFEGLSEKLSGAFKRLRNKGKLNESDVKEAMREVRLALLEADVNYKVAKEFTARVTERAIGSDVMESLTPAQMVVKIVTEELTALMGSETSRLEFASKPPTVIMMCGLQGSGKTTHSGKLGLMLKKQGHRPLLVACDVYRPAAIEQLKVVAGKAGVACFEMGQKNPVKIALEIRAGFGQLCHLHGFAADRDGALFGLQPDLLRLKPQNAAVLFNPYGGPADPRDLDKARIEVRRNSERVANRFSSVVFSFHKTAYVFLCENIRRRDARPDTQRSRALAVREFARDRCSFDWEECSSVMLRAQGYS